MSSLDENISVLEEDYAIKFPKFCDVTVRYQNTRFHLHSLMLVFESVYFEVLYENGVNEENREIVIPALYVFKQLISELAMKQFFVCLYARGEFNYDDVIGKRPKYKEMTLIHLAHYFQVDSISNKLKEINRTWLTSNPYHVLKQGLYALSTYEVYQWTDLFNSLKSKIEPKIEAVMGEKDNNVRAQYFFECLKKETQVDLQRQYVAYMKSQSPSGQHFS